VQIVPTALITPGSIRSAGALREMWSLHPVRLVETVAPCLFGKYTGLPHEITQWLFVLNDAREPLLFSIYLGVPAVLLAVVGPRSLRRSQRAMFWTVAGVVALVAAFGTHTPIYRAALKLVPGLPCSGTPRSTSSSRQWRSPVLAALGWDALCRGPATPETRRAGLRCGGLPPSASLPSFSSSFCLTSELRSRPNARPRWVYPRSSPERGLWSRWWVEAG
jgi:hypothetical protein